MTASATLCMSESVRVMSFPTLVWSAAGRTGCGCQAAADQDRSGRPRTAPLVVEALDRVLTGRTRTVGVASAGEIFDAPDFLRALVPHIALDVHPQKENA